MVACGPVSVAISVTITESVTKTGLKKLGGEIVTITALLLTIWKSVIVRQIIRGGSTVILDQLLKLLYRMAAIASITLSSLAPPF